jgi:hypothetical protein
MPEVEARMSEQFRALEGNRLLHGKLHAQLKAKELEYEFERVSVAARYEVMQPPTAPPLDYQTSTLVRTVGGFAIGALFGVLLALFGRLVAYARLRAEARAAG